MTRPPRVLGFLLGPTASGKTARALQWARTTGGAIISTDALLFYRGADIGTAKPTRAELAEVVHHGIDLCEPSEAFSIGDYFRGIGRVLEDASPGQPLLVTGGSGFYLGGFFGAVADGIRVPAEVRARVASLEREGGPEALREALRERVGEGPVAIDWENPRRLVPALERCLASGLTLAEVQARFRSLPEPFPDWEKRVRRLDVAPAVLEERIGARTRAMLEAGLVEEVRRLRELNFERNPTLSRAVGYREALAFLDGGLDRSGLEAAINHRTIRLARRQSRWIRARFPDAPVLRGEDVPDDWF